MRCVAEVGYSQATIREIARLADVTSASLYHYFPAKADLITAAFAEMADVVMTRLVDATEEADGVLNKLSAIFDECERINIDYPHAAAFDRAIRAESARHLHLGEDSESTFATLRELITGVIKKGRRQCALGAHVNVESASDAILVLIRGLNEYTTTAPPEAYHQTVQALKAMVRGVFFDYDKLAQ